MKKSRIALLPLCLCGLLLSGCACGANASSEDTEGRNAQIVTIYNLYLARGGTMTYEEWLESIRGEDGEPGQDGNGILSGFDVPSPSLGKNKDIYLNVSTWDIYVKEGDKWVIHGNIKGGQGDHGLNYSEENPQGLSFFLLDNGEYLVGAGYSTQLSDVTIPSTYGGKKVVGVIDDGFASAKMSSLTLGSNLRSFGARAFNRCSNLTAVYCDGSLEDYLSIESSNYYAGSYSNLLQTNASLYFLDTGGDISHNGKRYYSLESLTIPETITKILPMSLMGCGNLKTLTIPGQVSEIGKQAFQSCGALETIVVENPKTLKTIGESAFLSCPKVNRLYINGSLRECLDFAPGSLNISYETATGSYDLYYLDSDGTEVYQGRHYHGLESLRIPDDMTAVPKYFVCGCRGLKSVTIPSTVTSLGDYAFANCPNLEEVVFEAPSSLTSIGKGCFSGCASLKEIEIPDTVTEIGSKAFQGCSSLERFSSPVIYANLNVSSQDFSKLIGTLFDGSYYAIYVGNNSYYPATLKHIKTASSEIPDSAFSTEEPNGLETIELTSNLTSIGQRAFQNCTSLTEIIFHGTETQWNAMYKHSNWLGNISMPNIRFVA